MKYKTDQCNENDIKIMVTDPSSDFFHMRFFGLWL